MTLVMITLSAKKTACTAKCHDKNQYYYQDDGYDSKGPDNVAMRK